LTIGHRTLESQLDYLSASILIVRVLESIITMICMSVQCRSRIPKRPREDLALGIHRTILSCCCSLEGSTSTWLIYIGDWIRCDTRVSFGPDGAGSGFGLAKWTYRGFLLSCVGCLTSRANDEWRHCSCRSDVGCGMGVSLMCWMDGLDDAWDDTWDDFVMRGLRS